MKKLFLVAIVLVGFVALIMAPAALADNAKVLSAKVDSTLAVFTATKGSDAVLKQAEGLLVFPAITKAGFIFGGEYGEGALIVDNETKGFYNTVGGSFGFR